jgi:Tol biopolymer transport system component
LALPSGTRIGPYEVTAQIGVGGMGEVYRARDAKLGRDVAIKVLPQAVTSDPERVARFEREAKTLAALNHPNIASIYGFEESGGLKALVMELVEGPTLADRIAQGAIPVDEALPIAKQIAEALEAAHEQGIIHRDLKPANIKVRPDGTVKVLDFGLAKAMDPVGAPSASASQVPTITTPAMTQLGVILGTAAYMSPEQARGKPVDKRADIWAFGCVLFEMLSGRRVFGGDDVTETLSRVLQREPDFGVLPPSLSPHVTPVLRLCLARDPLQRLRDLGDVRLALDGRFAQDTAAGVMTTASQRGWFLWTVTAGALLALAGAAWMLVTRPRDEAAPLDLTIPIGDDLTPGWFALSPDSSLLAMIPQGNRDMLVYSMANGAMKTVAGTAGSRTPFWSPDSKALAYFVSAESRLKERDVSGGPARTLCDGTGNGRGGTWGAAGTILFANDGGDLFAVAPGTNRCSRFAASSEGDSYATPTFLPDGERFLYNVFSSDERRRGLYLASLKVFPGQRLLPDTSSGVYLAGNGARRGHLMFVREGALAAQPFDPNTGELTGAPVKVADDVSFTLTSPQVAASADKTGRTMVFATGTRPQRQLAWFDRSGRELERGPSTGDSGGGVNLSRSGQAMSFLRGDLDGRALIVRSLRTQTESRLARFPPLATGGRGPVWSPDGRDIAYRGDRNGIPAIVLRRVETGEERVLIEGEDIGTPSDWTHDGQWLVFGRAGPQRLQDIWVHAVEGSAVPRALVATAATEAQGQVSPDGRWLAYTSDEGGSLAVWVRPFTPAAGTASTRWQISPQAASQPRWRGDSRELFYMETVTGTTRRLLSVTIGPDGRPTSVPKSLFQFSNIVTTPERNEFAYAPTPDGKQFVVDVFANDSRPALHVLVNWNGDPAAPR